MPDPRYASLDLGSNTVRLLLAEKSQTGWFRPLRIERSITRLGGDFSPDGNLDEQGHAPDSEGSHRFCRIAEA